VGISARAFFKRRRDTMQGYVKIYRRLLESEVFEEPKLLKTWLWLLLNANWEDRQTRQGIYIERGQLVTSNQRAARALDCSVNTVRRHLKVLEGLKMIRIEADTVCTVVTICNYRTYQDEALKSHTATDTQTDIQTDMQTDIRIRKEEKNKRKGKRVFVFGDVVRDGVIASWVKYKRTGARYTDQQIEAFIKQVERIPTSSLELKVNRAIANGWKGLGDISNPEEPVKPAKRVNKRDVTNTLLYDAQKRLQRLVERNQGDTVTAESLRKEIKEYESTLHKTRTK
tara:strand:- start:1902 stop:2753 length:852 start_codon:yes stop_codon:yes gene_type:complete